MKTVLYLFALLLVLSCSTAFAQSCQSPTPQYVYYNNDPFSGFPAYCVGDGQYGNFPWPLSGDGATCYFQNTGNLYFDGFYCDGQCQAPLMRQPGYPLCLKQPCRDSGEMGTWTGNFLLAWFFSFGDYAYSYGYADLTTGCDPDYWTKGKPKTRASEVIEARYSLPIRFLLPYKRS